MGVSKKIGVPGHANPFRGPDTFNKCGWGHKPSILERPFNCNFSVGLLFTERNVKRNPGLMQAFFDGGKPAEKIQMGFDTKVHELWMICNTPI